MYQQAALSLAHHSSDQYKCHNSYLVRKQNYFWTTPYFSAVTREYDKISSRFQANCLFKDNTRRLKNVRNHRLFRTVELKTVSDYLIPYFSLYIPNWEWFSVWLFRLGGLIYIRQNSCIITAVSACIQRQGLDREGNIEFNMHIQNKCQITHHIITW